jgi:hypothetical protein
MASAEFTISGTIPTAPVAVAANATVALAVADTNGVHSVEWSIIGSHHHSATLPVLTLSGYPEGITVSAHMADEIDQAFRINCLVNGGKNALGEDDSALSVTHIIGVLNVQGLMPFASGEELERQATHGTTELLNEMLRRSGTGGGGAASTDYVTNDSDVAGATATDALNTLLTTTVPLTASVVAGAGMTGGGAFSIGNPTLNVIAHADGSIVVHANDVQVGVLATDAQHGVRGGGPQHSVATTTANGFMSSAQVTALEGLVSGAITDHGALTGLTHDDHAQYLLVSGTRAMGGALNMGGYAISSVGLVDGVDVSGHAARHLPGGADALTTGTPVTLGAALSPGDATSLSRSNHVHTHGDQLGGTLHALATDLAAGFLSAAGFTAIDDASTHVAIVSGNPHGTSFANLTGGTIAQLNTLVSDADLVPAARTVSAGNGLTGGGALTGNVTLAVGAANTTITVSADAIAVGIITDSNVTDGTLSVDKLVPGSAAQILGVSGGVTAWVSRASGDYTQYLLLDGTRTMTGALNMGGYAVTGVGLVDGVDVSGHAARHLPGGADALTTGQPVAIGSALSEGSGTALARASHVHTHGDQLGGTLHALATISTPGFLSAAGFSSIAAADSHVEIVSGNPHGVTFSNLVAGTLAQLNGVVSDANLVPEARTVTAGNGLTGGGALTGNITLTVAPNADGSIVVSSDAVGVGVLASDAQHGQRGRGSQHTNATTSEAGFLSSAGFNSIAAASSHVAVVSGNPHGTSLVNLTGGTLAQLNTLISDADVYSESDVNSLLTGYVPTSRTVTAGAGLTGGGALSGNVTLTVAAANSTITVSADAIGVGTITDANIANDSISIKKIAPGTANYVGVTNGTATETAWALLTSANLSATAGLLPTQFAAAASGTALLGNGAGVAPSFRAITHSEISTTANIEITKIEHGGSSNVLLGGDVYNLWGKVSAAHIAANAGIAATQLAAGAANTVLCGGATNTFSGTPSVTSLAASSYLAVGSDVSTSGEVRLSGTADIRVRNLANNGNANLIGRGSDGTTIVGDTALTQDGDSGITQLCGSAVVYVRTANAAGDAMSNVIAFSGDHTTFNHGDNDVIISDGNVSSLVFDVGSDGTIPTAPTNGHKLFSKGSELVARNVAGSYWELSPDDENGNYPSVLFTKTGQRRAFTASQTVTIALTELIPYLTATTGTVATFGIEITTVTRSSAAGSHFRRRSGCIIVIYNGTQWGVDVINAVGADSEDGNFKVIAETSSLATLTWNASTYYSSSPSLRFALAPAGTTSTWYEIKVTGPGVSL